ncbi:uncharacterized protein LOC110895677 isoform X1 [Helianthus annuus]|uniref:uncharacterized protein LOC110895677 isoform X1 n=1 Tax=Helianthus annuus TaxID=4232 RepID=UPI000B8FA7D0|nr:uncharacterized protein LOC110895677 isoform X1 [Helianthus annuus]
MTPSFTSENSKVPDLFYFVDEACSPLMTTADLESLVHLSKAFMESKKKKVVQEHDGAGEVLRPTDDDDDDTMMMTMMMMMPTEATAGATLEQRWWSVLREEGFSLKMRELVFLWRCLKKDCDSFF